MRKRIVAGNWKMNMDAASCADLVDGVVGAVAELPADEWLRIVLCPPFVLLPIAGGHLSGGRVELGAQNVHVEKKGAFTGEISVDMLRSVGCRYVIVGHSERRQQAGETDLDVRRKANVVLEAGMSPIICVGETEAERAAGAVESVIGRQVRVALEGILDMDADRCVIAYEPVWAIGTGNTATPEQAQAVHAYIRAILAELYTPERAADISIIYGGSMNPGNAAELFAQPDIDGGLVGGASLQADSFLAIVRAAL